MRDRGHAYDTVAAVLAIAGPTTRLTRLLAAEALTVTMRAATDDVMEDLSVAFTRAAKNLSSA
jgi:hypothetical protein